MPGNDDDVFANPAAEESGALAALRARLLAARGEEEGELEARRRARDERGACLPMPAGWRAAPIDLGRPGEHLQGPETTPSRKILYLHGGGYWLGSPLSHRALAAQIGFAARAAVATLEYRLAPEHPFPAALDDALVAYRRLLEDGQAPNSLVVMGDSAGGGLALALVNAVRAARLAPPMALVALSPWMDMTMSGESIHQRGEADPYLTLRDLEAAAQRYLGGADARDPRASPLFGSLAGLPPTLIHVGADEILLSDSERFVTAARAAGVDATLEIWPGLFHVWHNYFDEIEAGREAISEIGAWLGRRWPNAR